MTDRCQRCGAEVERVAARCGKCNRERTHRECYPDQYAHPLVGQEVQVKGGPRGVVERVVDTRFGKLAVLPGSANGYPVSGCEVATRPHPHERACACCLRAGKCCQCGRRRPSRCTNGRCPACCGSYCVHAEV